MYENFVHDATIISSRPRASFSHNGQMSNVAEKLRKLRESGRTEKGRHPSQQVVADALGLPKMTYVHYETGYKEDWLPQDLAMKLAEVLTNFGIPRDDVLALAKLDEGHANSLPSEATLRTILKVVLLSERADVATEDDLRVYGRLVHSALDDVASGRVSEDRQDKIEYGLRKAIEGAFLSKYAQAGS